MISHSLLLCASCSITRRIRTRKLNNIKENVKHKICYFDQDELKLTEFQRQRSGFKRQCLLPPAGEKQEVSPLVFKHKAHVHIVFFLTSSL